MHGLIPESLLENYQFWQDESSRGTYKRLRGYAINEASSYNDFILIIEIKALNSQQTNRFSVQKYEHLMPSKELITGLECRIDILEVPSDRLGLGGKNEIAPKNARILACGWWLRK